MALHHAASGEIIPVLPLGAKLTDSPSVALLKAHQLEVMRLVLVAGKSVPEHHVAGELTMQCLEGRIELRAHGKTQVLKQGDFVYLEGSVPYALHAAEHSSMLMTVVLLPDQSNGLAAKLGELLGM
ncbi:MAG: cupin protein [Burkholderia sp.]|nr:cupin protein [Burkholderia sp.]